MDVGQAAAAATVQTGATAGTPAPAPVGNSAPPAPIAADVDAAAAPSGAPSSGQGQAPADRGGIAPAIAKLFGGASPPEPIRLDVSYRVLRNPDQIVTVFSDPKTGAEVAQFPPDILVGLAQLFDSPRGVTLDRDA